MSFLKTVLEKIFASQFKKLTESDLNEYERELDDIVEKTIEEFKRINPIRQTDKIPFHDSKTFRDELIKYRLTKEVEAPLILQAIVKDGRIIIPTKTELDLFYKIFDDNIKQSKKLWGLNVEHNFKEEIFNISEKLLKFQTTLDEIKNSGDKENGVAKLLEEAESKLLIRLFQYQSPCKIAAAKGEQEYLWVPGDLFDMQWGYRNSSDPLKNQEERVKWILVVKHLLKRSFLKEVGNNHFELTERGSAIAYWLIKK